MINCPGTSVTSYKPIPHNIPKEQRPQFSLTEIKSVTPLSLLMNTSRIPSINSGLTEIFPYFYLSFILKHCSYKCIAGWLSKAFTSGVRLYFHGHKFITQFASCGSSETVDFKSTHSALMFEMVFFTGPSKLIFLVLPSLLVDDCFHAPYVTYTYWYTTFPHHYSYLFLCIFIIINLSIWMQ